MASQIGMSGGTPSDEAAKLAQAFKLSDNLKLRPGEQPDAAAMEQAHELLESSPFLKAKVEEAMRDPAQVRKMMEAHPDMRSKMQEAQHLIQQEPEWPEIQRKLQQAQMLLRQSSMPVSVLAHRFGFSSTSAFSRAYRKMMGHSPAQARGRQH